MTAAQTPDIDSLLRDLFGAEIAIERRGPCLSGVARLDDVELAVIGTVERAAIGVDLALELAGRVLQVMREHPRRPILLLIDNSGQRLSRRDELLGNNGYIAHLNKCLYVASQRGHRVLGLVYGEAVSGGFMATGMATDACYALPAAQLRVMAPAAMARITRIPIERLTELFRSSPVLGPGVENFFRIGALHGIWDGDLRACLRAALGEKADSHGGDARPGHGAERGGRQAAKDVAALVREGREA